MAHHGRPLAADRPLPLVARVHTIDPTVRHSSPSRTPSTPKRSPPAADEGDGRHPLFDDDYGVERAATIPVEVMQGRSTHRAHVTGHIAFATDDLLELGTDVTDQMQRVAGEA